ncbi:WecB/TagA/CpsF family glycosyltransferase [Listeria kieliensis]|uniref:WecB/TagA/CpsF family glycosyltransferase n=1 Tax=Listeria kieliensis TaxID=1621700 RepID=UPI001F0B8D8F|nr:WecB/TagA/CpsF family glycosyltransferase [Listeria kieliensis]
MDTLTLQETLERISKAVENREVMQHVVINASKINLMAQDAKLAGIINESPLINADGKSIVWAARFLGYKIPDRITGIDLFEYLVALAAQKEWRVYYFGATEEVVREVVRRHQMMYPKLKLAGFRNGYFTDEESVQIAREIHASQADLLFVGFSSPKKEYWISDYQTIMQVPFAMGVGGSFDIIAGKTKRAPIWVQRAGFEWLYRLLQEPRRLMKRYIIGNTQFIGKVLKERMQR